MLKFFQCVLNQKISVTVGANSANVLSRTALVLCSCVYSWVTDTLPAERVFNLELGPRIDCTCGATQTAQVPFMQE